MKINEEGSPVPAPNMLNIEEKKDDILTDNECYSLKIPSLKEYNLSNISKQDNSKFNFEDRLSESSLSNKMAQYNFPASLYENLTDQEKDEY